MRRATSNRFKRSDSSGRQVRGTAFLLSAALLLGGCATTPDGHDLLAVPVAFKTIEGAPHTQDGRARFRSIFCSMLRADGIVPGDDASCDRWLWRLPDEPRASQGTPAFVLSPEELVIYLVTGAFSECVGEEARPYSVGAAQLRGAGARVETIVVGGRSGTATNARQIADVISRAGVADGQTLIFIGYSKGSLDVLRFLVDFPALAAGVDAVVSVAGPIFGTPLADTAAPAYGALLDDLPYEKCPPGDGEVIRSLTPAATMQWLAANPLPAHVRYYSLAAFTTRDHVARALVPSWQLLKRADARNDGQVVAADAVIPGGTLLGYANADHWGIAQRIESVHTVLAARPDPELFPLNQLFGAIVQFVASDLRSADGAALRGTGTERAPHRILAGPR